MHVLSTNHIWITSSRAMHGTPFYARAAKDETREREKEMALTYKEYDIGTRRVDFFVEETIMLEIKAIKELEDVHLAQAINYLEAYKMKIGLLINFGNTRLQFKRVMKPKPKKFLLSSMLIILTSMMALTIR